MLGHVKGTLPVSGHLLRMLPNSPKDGQPATVELEGVTELLAADPQHDVLRSFPGPRVRYGGVFRYAYEIPSAAIVTCFGRFNLLFWT